MPDLSESAECSQPTREVAWVLSILGAIVNHRPEGASDDLLVPLCAERLFLFADEHALTPLLAWHLKKTGQIGQMASDIEAGLTSSFHASLARSLTQLDELAVVLGELEKQKIPAIPWKGPVLAGRLFEEAAARECSDLDILISPGSQSQAESAILSLGYQQEDYESDVRAELNEDHCSTFQHTKRPVCIELHSHPFPSSFPFPLSFEELELADDSPFSLGDRNFPILTADCELLLSSAHAAKHLWERLSWLVDIARIAEGMTGSEAESLHQLATKARCCRTIEVSLLMAEDLLGASIPESLRTHFAPSPAARRLARDAGRRILAGDSTSGGGASAVIDWITTLRMRMRTRETFRDRVRMGGCGLRYLVTPNANDEAMLQRFRLPKWMIFIFRPIRLLAKFVLSVFTSGGDRS